MVHHLFIKIQILLHAIFFSGGEGGGGVLMVKV